MSAHDDDLKRAEEAIAQHYAREQEGSLPPVPSTAYLWIPHRRWLAEQYPLPKAGEPRPLSITNPAAHHPEPFDSWLREHYPALAERREKDRADWKAECEARTNRPGPSKETEAPPVDHPKPPFGE